MESVRFYLPTAIFSGPGCVRKEAERWLLGKKALIVSGAQGAERSGALGDVTETLKTHGVAWAHFAGVQANPDVAQIYVGAELARQEGCDFVIGIGGGSPLDAAKAIAWVAGLNVPQASFFRIAPETTDAALPIVAVPLTCGTGSEVTPYAIITDHGAKTKRNVSAACLFPRAALLDARYLESLPVATMADTALDALSHAIEAAYSPRATRFSEALCLEATRLIAPELVRLAHGDFVNRAQLHYASTIAGMAIAQAGTGLVHAMGYPLTYYKGFPHGRANGVLLAGYLEFMERTCPSQTARLLQAAGLRDPEELQALVDAMLDTAGTTPEAPSEEELVRFAREPLRLDLVKKYRAMPSPEEVMDIYRTGF